MKPITNIVSFIAVLLFFLSFCCQNQKNELPGRLNIILINIHNMGWRDGCSFFAKNITEPFIPLAHRSAEKVPTGNKSRNNKIFQGGECYGNVG